jgi:hypothetical protein
VLGSYDDIYWPVSPQGQQQGLDEDTTASEALQTYLVRMSGGARCGGAMIKRVGMDMVVQRFKHIVFAWC